jgi:hypothetical protein
VDLNPVDIDFAIASLPEKRLLLQERVSILDESYIVTCFLYASEITFTAYHEVSKIRYEAKVSCDDAIFFLASPVEDTIAFCKWSVRRLSFTIDQIGVTTLHVPIVHINPFLRFTYDTWNGQSRSFHVRVYKAGNKILLVAKDRQMAEVRTGVQSRCSRAHYWCPRVKA